MKTRQLFAIILALSMAWMTSCTDKDSGTGSGMEGTQTFTFNVTTEGQAQTRAAAPSVPNFKMQYILQVLNADGSTLDLGSGKTQETNITGQFAVKLQVGKEYTCLFWAQYIPDSGDATTPSEYFTTTDLQEVTLKKPLTAGDQCQAFSATADIPAAPTTADITVTLVRAVAQVNQKSSVKMENYSKVGITYTDVPDKFNVLTKTIATNGSNNEATFEATSFPTNATAGAYPFHSAYVLASGDGNANMLKTELKIYNTASSTTPIQTVSIENVPTKKNFRTNVINTFASATTKHTYTFSYDEWGGNQNVTPASIWDGVTPSANASYTFGARSGDGSSANNAYIIADAKDFAQLMANVNSGTTYENKFFKLNIDIDLNNHNWTPIGGESKQFKGKFDGSMHTIFNLKINSNERYVGLFGFTDSNSSINNLHVSGEVIGTNTNLSDGYLYNYAAAGGICGISYGTIANCSFAGKVEAAVAAGGILGNAHDYSCKVSCSKNSASIKSKCYAGGIVGFGIGQVHESYNEGSIESDGTIGADQPCAAGIVAFGSDPCFGIKACYNIGTVKNTNNSSKEAAITSYDFGIDPSSFAIQSYTITVSNEKVFGSGEWPTDADGWAINKAAAGAEPNGYWKSLGNWNNGVNPEYPKLWWEK